MSTRVATLLQIREQFTQEGLSAAVLSTRAAYEAGRIDKVDIPEVFIALKSGSWRFLERLGVRISAPDGSLTKSTG
jgi:hypothetical protein